MLELREFKVTIYELYRNGSSSGFKFLTKPSENELKATLLRQLTNRVTYTFHTALLESLLIQDLWEKVLNRINETETVNTEISIQNTMETTQTTTVDQTNNEQVVDTSNIANATQTTGEASPQRRVYYEYNGKRFDTYELAVREVRVTKLTELFASSSYAVVRESARFTAEIVVDNWQEILEIMTTNYLKEDEEEKKIHNGDDRKIEL